MDPKDPTFDQFSTINDLALKWGSLEDDLQDREAALAKKKQQRRVQMDKRREKLPDVNSILKNKAAP